MAPTAGATDTAAAYATAPLGNNSKLSKIELSGLHNNQASAQTGNNQFAKISPNC